MNNRTGQSEIQMMNLSKAKMMIKIRTSRFQRIKILIKINQFKRIKNQKKGKVRRRNLFISKKKKNLHFFKVLINQSSNNMNLEINRFKISKSRNIPKKSIWIIHKKNMINSLWIRMILNLKVLRKLIVKPKRKIRKH
jgi:hypothetical protein